MNSLLVCQNCNWSIVFWKMKQRVLFKRSKKKNGDNACTWKLLPSILIDWKRPSVAQADIFFLFRTKNDRHFVGHRIEIVNDDRHFTDFDLHETAIFRFLCSLVRRRSEIPKIWEDNKTMQMCFTLITWNMVMSSLPFVTCTGLRC